MPIRRRFFVVVGITMYESFLRSACDPWFSPDRVDWHRGSRHDFTTRAKLAVINAVREGKQAIESIGPLLPKWISDARLLREAWDILAAKGDTAPGPNGRRYDDLDDMEVWSLLRSIGRAIRNDTYGLGEERIVNVPKDRADPSRGTRPISLINIEDRVVQRAVVEVLQRLVDPLFGPNILGYRPGHGRLHALALAEQTAIAEGRFVLVVEDIKDAFTRVPLQRLLDVLTMYIPSEEVLRLLRRILDTGKKHGIRQGGPLSPLLLNVYLHHVLDEPWRKAWPTIPMIRVADDILLQCRSRAEADRGRNGLETILRPANMPLKRTQEDVIHDLNEGESARWLGFEFGKGDQSLIVKVAKKAWTRLEEYLVLAHEKPDSSIRAVETINGWIEQMGPCFPFVRRPRVYEKLAKLAAEQAFDEIPSRNAIISRWRRAYERWCGIRNAVRDRPEVLDSVFGRAAGSGATSVDTQVGTGDAERHGAKVEGANMPSGGGDKFVPPWE
jgi:hypothetical protein